MKAILVFLSTLVLTLGLSSEAKAAEYEINYPSASSSVPYPGLDLNMVKKVKVKTSSSIHTPEQSLDEVEIVFENATNLIVKGFQKEGGSYSYNGSEVYRAVAHDAWVYSKVLVTVTAPGKISGGKDLTIDLQVMEMTNALNELNYSHGLMIFNANGILNDVTPMTVADVETISYQEKDMTLTLYQKPKFDEFNGEGFKIKVNWMGNGEKIINVPAPIPAEEYSFFKAADLEIQTQTFPDGFTDHQFRIKYQDPFGYTQETPLEPLAPYIDQAFQTYP
ncbi:hypothetical protein [Pseudoalteromonas sp. T1lg75]|uniref:hypothetical protein n=1 Tax=Pseudoalteromonas sp. T1lg75 TaxID=2077102 RepID=UPI000CF6383E|nr:hypothetical protein [Pseudoalteromonas sp. T1lg75]